MTKFRVWNVESLCSVTFLGFCQLDFGWHVLTFSKYFLRRRHPPFTILVDFTKMWHHSGPEMSKVDRSELFSGFCRLDFWWHVLMFSSIFSGADILPYMILADFTKMWQGSGSEMSKIDGLELFPDFAGWILGDASLRFQSIFGGSDGAPFRILLNFMKMRSSWGPEMLKNMCLALFSGFCWVDFGWHVLTFSKYFRRLRRRPL